MVANDKLNSDGVEPVTQVRSPRVLEFYDPVAYLAAAYPLTLQPFASAAVAETKDKSEIVTETPSLMDRSREHSRRAARALAEVHSTARERGLLKAPPTSAGWLDAADIGAGDGASTSDRLVAVANWLGREGDVSGLFLLDERGYSLLPESEGSVGDDVILHDLGMRLSAVLDLVPRRLELAAVTFQKEAPIARMTLDGGRSLAIMRLAPHGALLAWIEGSSMPLAAPLAQMARTRLLALLTEDADQENGPAESADSNSVASACSNAS